VARAKVADLSKRNTVLRRFFTTQVANMDALAQSAGYRSADLQTQVEAMGKHKLALTRMEVCFQQLEENETQFETDLGGTEDATGIAEKAHYYHYFVYENLCVNTQDKASKLFLMVEAEKEKARLEKKSVILPKLSLPTFHGRSSAEWCSFIGVFSALMDKSQTEKSEKFAYLKLCLQDDAKILADGYTEVTNDNYDKLLAQLKQRYGLKRLIARDHYQGIIALPAITWATVSSVLNSLQSHVMSLESLGVQIEEIGGLLNTIVIEKMSKDLGSKYEEICAEDQNYSTRKLLEYLETKAKAATADTSNGNSKGTSGGRKDSPRSSTSALTTFASKGCTICDMSNHQASWCRELQQMQLEERYDRARQRNLCFRCFEPVKSGHGGASKCRNRDNQCSCGRHHKMMCTENPRAQQRGTAASGVQQGSKNRPAYKGPRYRDTREAAARQRPADTAGANAATADTAAAAAAPLRVNAPRQVLIKTCEAILLQKGGRKTIVRLLIDEGADATFISKEAADRCGLALRDREVKVSGFGSAQAPRCRHDASFTLRSMMDPGKQIDIRAAIVCPGVICEPMRPVKLDPGWTHLEDLDLAEDYPRSTAAVDVLLGADYANEILYSSLELPRVGKRNAPVAIPSIFGYLLQGPTGREGNSHSIMRVATEEASFRATERLLKRFWDLEDAPSTKGEDAWSAEDVQTMKHFKENIVFDQRCGRYQVKIPYEEGTLIDNSENARSFLRAQERALTKNAPKRDAYVRKMQEHIHDGVVEKVDPLVAAMGKPVFYLPHHLAQFPKKPRIVWNASVKDANGRSLNDLQPTGPNLIPEIGGLLMRFSRHRYVIMGDIKGMFLNIMLHPNDRDAHRFFWRSEDYEPMQLYRHCRCMFGEKISLFISVATVLHHAELNKEAYPRALRALKENLYVDDLLEGNDCLEQLIKLRQELSRLMESGGFKLRKWISNSAEVLQTIPEAERHPSDVILGKAEGSVADYTTGELKALGIVYDPIEDTMGYPRYSLKHATTKKGVVANIAHLFDPRGWLAPFCMMAKIFLQKLWLRGSNWDQPMATDMQAEWDLVEEHFDELHLIKYPRKMSNLPWDLCKKTLHGFGDASEKGYCAVVYLRMQHEGEVDTAFLMSKTRVAPTKSTTLPRLELQSAVLLTRLMRIVQKELTLESTPTMMWTDSEITLAWLQSHSRQLKTFVANRVAEVQEAGGIGRWNWLPGLQNPADVPTRGSYPLTEEQWLLWRKGPTFLLNEDWPAQPQLGPAQLELKTETKVNLMVESDAVELPIDAENFSSWKKLLKTTSYVYRWRHGGEPHADCWKKAKILWIKQMQKTSNFSANMATLIDEDGLIVVDSRIKYAERVPAGLRNPYIISTDAPKHLIKLIVMDAHEKVLHSGPTHTLAALRNEFWLVRGRSMIKRILKDCVVCKKWKAPAMQQRMAPLPKERITPSAAFQTVGIDYCGPLYVKNGQRIRRGTKKGKLPDEALEDRKWRKMYVCLITCATSRGVHLELCPDLTAEGFLLAFKRFVSRRGMPTLIISDNGSNFEKADKEIKRWKKALKSEQVQQDMALKEIRWQFNAPSSPWWGGFFERMVRSVKEPLRKVFGHALMTEEELTTSLCEVEAMVNSRPLTYVSDDDVVLTPAHLMIGRDMHSGIVSQPPTKEIDTVKRWRYRNRLVDSYWNRWTQQYLPTLHEFKKWKEQKPELRVGDVVLVNDGNRKRGQWPMASVREVIQGRDGLIRSAVLSNGLRRPVQRLHLFEAATKEEVSAGTIEGTDVTQRPTKVNKDADSTNNGSDAAADAADTATDDVEDNE
jgi:hypothetical protein